MRPFPPKAILFLVPKLCLDTPLGGKLRFPGGGVGGSGAGAHPPADHPLRAKQSFAPKGIPKRSLGTSYQSATPRREDAGICREGSLTFAPLRLGVTFLIPSRPANRVAREVPQKARHLPQASYDLAQIPRHPT